ncbi:unnamed protein product [Phytophthora lilii]|uniref:Unnamed protein product n=1 Tax=Phytophthora lilii TaxID=2077276 RepID=A0A9W7D8S2_9STRA|nr:unnamed protein product [Phytophthora lilii]
MPADEREEQKPPPTPKRRAKEAENGGDEKNKTRSCKKAKKEDKKAKRDAKKEETPAPDTSKLHGCQLLVDVHYRGEQYAEARILDLDPEKEMLFVHYMGWNARFDAWVPLDEVAAHGSQSGVPKKKDVSWDGDISLFATEEEAAAHRQNGKTKTKANKTKKRTILSPKARQAARKALRSANNERKKHSEEVVETEEAPPATKRTVKKSPKNAKAVKKAAKSPRAGKKVSAKKAASPARRTTRRVQVAVGTTDEDSERKNDSGTADLVLDVEIEGHEASNDEVEGEDIEEEESPSSRTKKRAGAKSKTRGKGSKEVASESKRKRDVSEDEAEDIVKPVGAKRSPANKSKKVKKGDISNKAPSKPVASAKTAPLPSRPGRGGLGSATREKLAAIFRLRVQQKQQMEQMNASQAGFQQALQDETVEAAATTAESTSSTAETAEAEASNITMVNAEIAAAEEYQRQLQQYYYHQQVMLANSLSMSMSGAEDPSTIPLQGGIMDPRIIQDRLTALEERRRQQAHVQAYYHQLMLTRERNVRALAANQAFMAASAVVWEQQLRETQSEDGTSSVTSWKDVTGDSSETGKDSPKAEPASEATAAATGSDAGDADSSKGDNDGSAKESETSSPAVTASNDVTSPDTVEKAAEGSADSSPAKSVSAKCAPADAPAQSVLYEFVL